MIHGNVYTNLRGDRSGALNRIYFETCLTDGLIRKSLSQSVAAINRS